MCVSEKLTLKFEKVIKKIKTVNEMKNKKKQPQPH